MIDTPHVTHTAEAPMAFIHLTVPRAEIRSVMGPGLEELRVALAAQGTTPSGPWFTHHRRMDPAVFDFEICLPVPGPIAPAGRVQAGSLPAATVARTVLHGGYEGLADAWGRLESWIAAQGHRSAPDLWERYVVGPETSADPADWRTELNRPLLGHSSRRVDARG
jgi:effector-binding domain-containing protein